MKKTQLGDLFFFLGVMTIILGVILWIILIWEYAGPPHSPPQQLQEKLHSFWQLWLNSFMFLTLPFSIGAILIRVGTSEDEGWIDQIMGAVGIMLVGVALALPAYVAYLLFSLVGYLGIYLPYSLIVDANWIALLLWGIAALFVLGGLFKSGAGEVVGVLFIFKKD